MIDSHYNAFHLLLNHLDRLLSLQMLSVPLQIPKRAFRICIFMLRSRFIWKHKVFRTLLVLFWNDIILALVTCAFYYIYIFKTLITYYFSNNNNFPNVRQLISHFSCFLSTLNNYAENLDIVMDTFHWISILSRRII